MPSFLFAAGYSYRLATQRRTARSGAAEAWRHTVARSLELILISMVLFGFNRKFDSWAKMTSGGVYEFRGGAGQGQPLGSARDHRRLPTRPPARHRLGAGHPRGGDGGGGAAARGALPRLQLRLRLRASQRARCVLGRDGCPPLGRRDLRDLVMVGGHARRQPGLRRDEGGPVRPSGGPAGRHRGHVDGAGLRAVLPDPALRRPARVIRFEGGTRRVAGLAVVRGGPSVVRSPRSWPSRHSSPRPRRASASKTTG